MHRRRVNIDDIKICKVSGGVEGVVRNFLLSVRVCVLRFLFMVHGRAMTSASQEALTVA